MLAIAAMVALGMDAMKPVAVNGAWKLAWHDEFDVDGLPNPDKWTYEVGYVRNNEAQYYTKERLDNARVEDGRLRIRALADGFEGHKVTSASVTTQGKKSFEYGLIEVRAKVPTGKGTWPAIWTLGANIDKIGWPRCGEIDIMENVGFDPAKIHGTCHWNSKLSGHHEGLGKNTDVPGVWQDYHVYSVDWTPAAIDFYVDKTMYHHFPIKRDEYTDEPFNAEHYLILNLAIGGDWGGRLGIDDSIYPSNFDVDYVRYYQRK